VTELLREATAGITLREAIERAVSDTHKLLSELETSVTDVFARADSPVVASPEWDEMQVQIVASIARHKRDAGAFRVVLFGRTGSGKSSLIEALSEGDGRSISTGVSDFTTDTRAVTWGPLELVDTPGFGGWGRTRDPSELEAIASEAVSRADLVILAFDTQIQQTSEFEAVHAQIQRYGRPCLAVLNVRNPRWRDPALSRNHARAVQRQVEGNARRITAELAQSGLREVPVVAVNSQLAVTALASDHYAGPDAPLVAQRRTRSARSDIELKANVRILVELLSQTLGAGAPQLRLQSLQQDIAGQVSVGVLRMQGEADESSAAFDAAVEALRSVLAAIGVGQTADAGSHRPGRWMRSALGDHDWLEESGKHLSANGARLVGDGVIQNAASGLISIHLTRPIRELRELGDQVAHAAMTRSESVSGERLIEKLDPGIDKIQAATNAALEDVLAEFQDQLAGLELSFNLQLDLERLRSIRIQGKVSQATANSWATAEMLVAVGTAVGVILTGPLALAVAAVGTLVGWLLGRKRRKEFAKVEKRKAKARAKAISTMRGAVDEIAQIARSAVHAEVARLSGEMAAKLIPPLAQDIANTALRRDTLCSDILALNTLTECEAHMSGDAVIRATAAKVRNLTKTGAGKDPLLGTTDGPAMHQEVKEALPEDTRPLEADLDVRATRAVAQVSGACGRYSFTPTTTPVTGGRPVVGVLGRPGVGSTSLARELRRAVDGRWTIREMSQSGSGASKCDLFIWIFAPNPTVDSHPAFRELLDPAAPSRDTVLARSVFVIGRADELGPDPVTEPLGFRAVLDRKARELADMLSARDIAIEPGAVMCVAARPFGLKPGLLPSFDAVSGLGSLSSVLTPALALSTRGARKQHDTTSKAVAKAARAGARLRVAEDQLATLDEAIEVTGDATTVMTQTVAEFEARATTSIGDYVDGLAVAVVASKDANQLKERLKKLNRWTQDPEVARNLQQWQRDFIDAQDRAARGLHDDLEELFLNRDLDDSTLDLGPRHKPGSKVGTPIGTLGRILGAAGKNRDSWYNLVKFVSRKGFKFKPWGAIKGAKLAGRFGAALAVIGIAITALELFADGRARQERDRIRAEVLGEARKSVSDVLSGYLWAETKDGECGPLRFAEMQIDELTAGLDSLREDRRAVARRYDRALRDSAAAVAALDLLTEGR